MPGTGCPGVPGIGSHWHKGLLQPMPMNFHRMQAHLGAGLSPPRSGSRSRPLLEVCLTSPALKEAPFCCFAACAVCTKVLLFRMKSAPLTRHSWTRTLPRVKSVSRAAECTRMRVFSRNSHLSRPIFRQDCAGSAPRQEHASLGSCPGNDVQSSHAGESFKAHQPRDLSLVVAHQPMRL